MSTKEKNKIIAIIPARGGSKRIPGKNKKLMNGNPLISYTIKPAIDSFCFDKIVVSSDDNDILNISEQLGVETDRRPRQLAGDKVKAVEVITEYLERNNTINEFEHVAMLLPTCPFRLSEDIKRAVEDYQPETNFNKTLLSVTKYDFPPQLALSESGPNCMGMIEPNAYKNTRSQSIKSLYHPNGAIYLLSIKEFLGKKTFFQDEMLTYIMPEERSFDIDYPYQFYIAEQISKIVNK